MSEKPVWESERNILSVEPYGEPRRAACAFLNRASGTQIVAYYGAWSINGEPGSISLEMKATAANRNASARDELERLLAHTEACREWLQELIAALPSESSE